MYTYTHVIHTHTCMHTYIYIYNMRTMYTYYAYIRVRRAYTYTYPIVTCVQVCAHIIHNSNTYNMFSHTTTYTIQNTLCVHIRDPTQNWLMRYRYYCRYTNSESAPSHINICTHTVQCIVYTLTNVYIKLYTRIHSMFTRIYSLLQTIN